MSYIHQMATIDFDALRKYRVEILQKAMKEYGIDAYFVCYPGNVRYMTDYHMLPEVGMETAFGSILFQEGEPYLFPLSGDYAWIIERIGWISKDHIHPLRSSIGGIHASPEALDHFCKHLGQIFEREKIKEGKLAVDALNYVLWAELRKRFPKLEIVDHSLLLLRRQSRCEEELKIIKLSTAITNAAAAKAISMLKEGNRECDVAAEVGRFYYKENVDCVTWSPQILSGPNVAPYFRLTTDRILEYGDPWYFDIGAQFLGYCSTISLFGTIGKPSEKQREAYRALYDATQAALKVMVPGRTTAEVFEAADRVMQEYGYTKYVQEVPDIPFIPCISPIPPSLGWGGEGIGTMPHEPPNISGLSKEKPVKLVKNMVFRLHPNFFIPKVGGGRLKNMVIVRETGPEILTRTFDYGAEIFNYP